MIFNYISKYKQKAHKEVKVIKSRCEVEKLKSDRVSFVLEATVNVSIWKEQWTWAQAVLFFVRL